MVVDNSADEYIVGCAPSSPSPPRLTLEKGGGGGGGGGVGGQVGKLDPLPLEKGGGGGGGGGW